MKLFLRGVSLLILLIIAAHQPHLVTAQSDGLVRSPDGRFVIPVPDGFDSTPTSGGIVFTRGTPELTSDPNDVLLEDNQVVLIVTFPSDEGRTSLNAQFGTTDDAVTVIETLGSFFNEQGRSIDTAPVSGQNAALVTGTVTGNSTIAGAIRMQTDSLLLIIGYYGAESRGVADVAVRTILESVMVNLPPDVSQPREPLTAANADRLVQLIELSNPSALFFGGSFSPDNTLLALEDRGAVLVYEVATTEEIFRVLPEVSEDSTTGTEYGEPVFLDNNRLAYVSFDFLNDGTNFEYNPTGTTIVDLNTGESSALPGESIFSVVNTLDLSIRTNLDGQSLSLVSVSDGSIIRDVPTETVAGWVAAPIYSSDGSTVITQAPDAFTVYDGSDFAFENPRLIMPHAIPEWSDAALSPDGSRFALLVRETAFLPRTILVVFSTITGEPLYAQDMGPLPGVELQFNTDGSAILIAQASSILILETETGEILRNSYILIDGNIEVLTVSSDGGFVLVAGGNRAALWAVLAE